MPRSAFQEWIGVGEHQNRFHTQCGKSRTTQVVGDHGDLGGKPVGTQTDHWDGRQDGKVSAAETIINVKAVREGLETHRKLKGMA